MLLTSSKWGGEVGGRAGEDLGHLPERSRDAGHPRLEWGGGGGGGGAAGAGQRVGTDGAGRGRQVTAGLAIGAFGGIQLAGLDVQPLLLHRSRGGYKTVLPISHVVVGVGVAEALGDGP